MKKSILFFILCVFIGQSFAQNDKTKKRNWNYNSGWGGERIVGEGPSVKETRDVADFKGVESGISADIYLKQSSGYKVVVEGQKNIIAHLKIEKKADGTLKLTFEKGYSMNYKEPLKVYVEAPQFEKLGMSGSGNVVADGALSGNNLDIYISGSGDFDLNALKYSNLDISVSGSGDMVLGGSAESINFSVSGSGDIKAGKLKAKKVRCSVSGSGDINCNASEALEASVSGSGDILYSGRPASVKTRVSGSGDIEARD